MMARSNLNLVETIVVVMMENRSFDHMLGYLSLPPSSWKVDGLSNDPKWLARYANTYDGKPYTPFHLAALKGTKDPFHDRQYVSDQLGTPVNGVFPMTGFVKSYADRYRLKGDPAVMGYYAPNELPLMNFFARSFAVCDKWFSSLPTATQPNKLMALSGNTFVDKLTITPGIPYRDLIYDWLTKNQIYWRLYTRFVPFLFMLAGWPQDFLTVDNYRHFSELKRDVTDPKDRVPQVIFIEPWYTIQGLTKGNDYHAPASIVAGERFLLDVYKALTANPERWRKTLVLVTWDEHGGFFDHVSPLPIRTNPPRGANYAPFLSTGVRVPAFVLSPLVKAGTLFPFPLDHTSILRLLAERFGKGSYSPEVDQRQQQGLRSITEVLNLGAPRTDIPVPPEPPAMLQQPPFEKVKPQVTEEANAVQWAIRQLKKARPDLAKKFPELGSFD